MTEAHPPPSASGPAAGPRALAAGYDALAAGYDALAPGYDGQMPGTEWIRARLWALFAEHLPPAGRVVDAGCGTGLDTTWLSARGHEVLAVDVSPGMLAVLRARPPGPGPAPRTRVLDLDHLDGIDDGPYDGLVSSFAAINTVRDPAAFGAACARLVRPGGVVVLHALGRFPAWRVAGLLRRGRLQAALTDLADPVRVVAIGDAAVPHRRWSPRAFHAAHLSPAFRLLRVEGVAALRPPHPSPRFPRPLLDALARVEARAASLPGVRAVGDQWILVARREGPPSDVGTG